MTHRDCPEQPVFICLFSSYLSFSILDACPKMSNLCRENKKCLYIFFRIESIHPSFVNRQQLISLTHFQPFQNYSALALCKKNTSKRSAFGPNSFVEKCEVKLKYVIQSLFNPLYLIVPICFRQTQTEKLVNCSAGLVLTLNGSLFVESVRLKQRFSLSSI